MSRAGSSPLRTTEIIGSPSLQGPVAGGSSPPAAARWAPAVPCQRLLATDTKSGSLCQSTCC